MLKSISTWEEDGARDLQKGADARLWSAKTSSEPNNRSCIEGLADCAMLSGMSSLSSLVELVRNVVGVFIDALSFFRLTLRSPSALAAENLFLRKQLGLYIER